jgi:acetyltransferase-like isoleucine patch superfamily enzyme/dTDP-4-dehydrorhamnose 3,5-epimerase-like enzyme
MSAGKRKTTSKAAFVHPQGLCETRRIGARTRVWAFAHILPGARIGADCNICDHTFVENDVVVGDRVTVKCGVQLWDGVRLENDVFIGPNATFSNDRFPRSRKRPKTFLVTVVKEGASIGANATILPGVTIGRGAMVGAGAVVVESVPPYAVVAGNPARIVSYCDAGPVRAVSAPTRPTVAAGKSRVKGVFVQDLAEVADLRGNLVAGEIGKFLPFAVKRFFVVHGVSSRQIRGQHAHRKCHQFLVCVQGSCRVIADDGRHREEFLLDAPARGVYLPPKTWGVQYDYSADASLLVFASHAYDPGDYIRDYEAFRRLVRR